MILSDHQRRWDEIRLYYFVRDMFQLRKNTTDVIAAADAICQIGDVNISIIRGVITKMLNDPYFVPYKSEILTLGIIMKYPAAKLANYMKMTRQAVGQHAKRHIKEYEPYPKYEIDESHEIHKFLEILDKLQKVGL